MPHARWIGVLLLMLCAGCSDARSGRASEGGGVPEWTVAMESLVSIGVVDGSPEYVFNRIASVRILPDGRVAVADGSSASIRLYDADGRFELQLGREGAGPGEFMYLSGLWVRSPDTLIAYDAGSLRLSRFSASGAFLGDVSFRGEAGLYLGTFEGGDHVVAGIVQGPRDRSAVTPDVMQMVRYTSDGEPTAVLATDMGMRRLGRGPVPMSPHFLGAVLDGAVYHTDGLRGEIRVTSPSGKRLRTIRTGMEEWASEAAWSRLEEGLEDASDPDAVQRLSEVSGAPGLDTIPSISELIVAADGRLWLKRYDPSVDTHLRRRRLTGGTWLVVEVDGARIALVSVPSEFRLMDVRGDRVAGVVRDALGVERVQVRSLRRPGGA